MRLAPPHPYFTNGFVMVSSVANSTLSFADEKVHQFEIMGYYNEYLQGSIRSAQLKGGYWDQNIRNPGAFLPRAGGVNYSNAWQQVNRTTTRRVYLESWNEYDEGSGLYAVTNSPPYIAPGSGNPNTDVWSATGDPFEYIKTTAKGAGSFNDAPAQSAKILWHNIPATLMPGETRTVTVIVRNAGDASWTASTNYKLGQGDADTAFVAGKRVLINDTQDEIPLYGGIFRGRAKAFQMTLTAPAALGSYTTHWRMVQEGVAWFGEELTVSITVKTKTAATVTLSNLSQVADGTAKTVTATTTPAGLTVSLTYNGSVYAPADAGSYTVVGIINDSTYQGRATNTLAIKANPNLFANGSFECNANGASVTSPPDVVNSSTILGWRVFNVDSGNVAFSATIISNASVGSRALRLDITNATGTSSYGLDQWDPGMHTPVQYGTNYIVSFDAAWIAGASTNNLLVYMNEFDSAGIHIGDGVNLGVVSISATGYKTFTFAWTAANTDATEIGLGFRSMPGTVGTTTLSLDNVRLEIPTTVPVNGDFEYSPIGTSAVLTTPTIDSATFPGWRIFSLGAPPINSFVGTIVNAGNYTGGQPGSHAMRLDIDNTGSPVEANYALDTDNARVPVISGNAYTLSFEVELDGVTGGTMALEVSIAEYDAGGNFTGTQGIYTPTLPTDQAFHRYTMDYVIQNANTTQVTIGFRPRNPGFVSALVLDNVVLAPYVPIANTVTVYRAKGSATQIKMAKIMSSQPLGSTFVANSATTVNGATLTSDTDTIYVPASSVDDSFTYTLRGFGGATGAGTVVVKVGAPTGLPVTAFPNDSFESDALGAAAGSSTPYVTTTTFANWRLFTVGAPPIALFAGTIQDASTTDAHTVQGGVPGSHAMRLDVDNTGTPVGADYGLDRNDARVPVMYGVTYTFSFDAALYGITGGSFTLAVAIPEFNGAGAFTGSQASFAPVLDGAYRTYSYSWTPLNPATAVIAPAFRPLSPGFACAMGLDNVVLHAPVANPSTIARVAGFPAQVKISDLLTNCTDTQNHPLTLASYSAITTNGATLTSDGTYIYVPANTVSDSFAYKITDGLGATNTGIVFIPAVNVFAQTTGTVSVTSSNVTASFTGIPGYSYTAQRATNVLFTSGLTNWPSIVTPSNGLFHVTDTFSDLGGIPRQAYYRLRYP